MEADEAASPQTALHQSVSLRSHFSLSMLVSVDPDGGTLTCWAARRKITQTFVQAEESCAPTSAEIWPVWVLLYWFWAFSYRFREFRCLVSSQVQVLLNHISWSFVSVEFRRRIVLFHPSLVLCSVLFDHVCLQGALQLSVSDPEKTLLSVLCNTNTITANWMWSEEELREN